MNWEAFLMFWVILLMAVMGALILYAMLILGLVMYNDNPKGTKIGLLALGVLVLLSILVGLIM